MKSVKIAKGITLCLFPMTGYKTARVSFNTAMPLNDGKCADRALLFRLLTRTCRNYPTIREMALKLGMLYGTGLGVSVIKNGESQCLSIYSDCIDDKFALTNESILLNSLSFLLDLIFKPNIVNGKFPKEDFEVEKRLLKEKIQGIYDDKRVYALNRMVEEMCKNEAFGLPKLGTTEEVEGLTDEKVLAAFSEILLTAPIYINVAGSFDEEKVTCLVKEKFAPVQRERVQELHTEFLSEAYDETVVKETQNVKQCKVVLGMRAGMTYEGDNYYALKVMTDIFGGGTYSKLFMNVREKQSLCYYCSARLDSQKGIIVIQCGVEKENVQKAIDAIKHEFAEMQKGNFDDETIISSKISITDMLKSACDTPESLESWYAGQHFNSVIYEPSEMIEAVNAVTREEIIGAASFVTMDTIYILEGKENEE